MSKELEKKKVSNKITIKQDIVGTLGRLSGEFKKALPSHIPVERFMRVVQSAILSNSKLTECPRVSLWAACVRAAESGLIPDGAESALVPYGNTVKFMPMVAGLMKLARNSGNLKGISAHLVYDNEDFSYRINEGGEKLDHSPIVFGEKGKLIGCYALALTDDGGKYIEVMGLDDIKAIESASRGKNTPWKGPFRSEMIKKSVIRRLCKRLPSSNDLDKAIEADNEFVDLNQPEPITRKDIPKGKTRIEALVEASKEPEIKEVKEATPAKKEKPKATKDKTPIPGEFDM